MLFLLACAQDNKESANNCPIPDDYVTFSGFTHIFTAEHVGDPMPGVAVTDLENPCNQTISDSEGNWSLDFANEPYIHFMSTLNGHLTNYVHIDPIVEQYPDFNWPYALITHGEVEQFFQTLDIEPDFNKSILIIDILDIDGQGLPGGTVNISQPYLTSLDGSEASVWQETNVSSGITDIVFINVEPGTVTLSGTDPEGTACRVPPAFEVLPGTLTMSTVYCAYDAADIAE